MDGYPERLAGALVSADEEANLGRMFEDRLADSSALAYRVAYGVLRHREDAEDVAQEAFARAHRRIGQLRDRERFRAWLVRMTWRLALDRLRAERRRRAREQAAAPPVSALPGFEADAMAHERSARLWQAIDALPEKLRLVIVLAAIEDYGVRDVSRLLDIPVGTVKSRLFDARRRLRELLT